MCVLQPSHGGNHSALGFNRPASPIIPDCADRAGSATYTYMGTPLTSLELPRATVDLLARNGFSSETFSRLQGELRAGDFPLARNQLQQPVAPLEPGDLSPWPEGDTATELIGTGQQAIAAGEVGVLILNGGMATRFGGRVKGVVEVVDGWSFLGLRLANIAAAAAPGRITTFLMNSFATDEKTREHLVENEHFGVEADRVHCLTQRISLRLRPDGELYRDKNGEPSPYAPGHGDVFEVLAESEAFARFVAGGGKHVMLGNVDNLGVTVSAKVIGAHILGGKPVTVEVAPRNAGDKGGAPVRIGGRVEILEGFRFPPDFDIDSVPVFNTNSLVVDVGAVRADYDLTWFRADKKIGDDPVVQFERLMGEVTAFQDTTYLQVPRQGLEDRFMPVKTPADLDALRERARERVRADSGD